MVTASPAPWAELDADGRGSLAVDGVEPRLRARPSSVEELADVLARANADGLAVLPRGGGTRLGLGNRPARFDLVVETSALDQVIEYEPADLTVTVQAGMRLAELQSILRAQGQLLALDPPALPASTVGGVVAANASGPLRFQYGTARDLVIGLRVANADGRVTKAGGRVVKNVAGYDLNKLYVGSLGTLGILVELSFRLNPLPPAERLVAGAFSDANQARSFLSAILHSPLSPLGIELVGPAAAETLGLPRATVAALRVGGYPAAVERQVRDLSALLTRHGAGLVELPDATWNALRDLALRDDAALVMKASAPVAEAVTLVALLEERLAPFDPLVWAHAGNGIAYATCRSVHETTTLVEALAATRRQVAGLASNASLVLEQAPAAVKGSLDVWGDPGPSLQLMRALKAQFDPRSTLNPGRFVGGL